MKGGETSLEEKGGKKMIDVLSGFHAGLGLRSTGKKGGKEGVSGVICLLWDCSRRGGNSFSVLLQHTVHKNGREKSKINMSYIQRGSAVIRTFLSGKLSSSLVSCFSCLPFLCFLA